MCELEAYSVRNGVASPSYSMSKTLKEPHSRASGSILWWYYLCWDESDISVPSVSVPGIITATVCTTQLAIMTLLSDRSESLPAAFVAPQRVTKVNTGSIS
jgi:uncharacterized membrane protein